ncbi:hypothetical protein KSP40_PGU021882 [Platanthera guangdongensis]|uniref:VOC domain-containing protein n=1 Tax=Platanthera guangdongensis TaxID=2320717 RepID=A0ABR2LX95_9ASPA
MAARAIGVRLNHIARESSDVKRLAAFYQEVLGFERIESPNYRDFEVIWLRLSPDVTLHLIERHHLESKLPEGIHVSPPASVVTDPRVLPRSHHVCFGVSNYDDFVQSLKERGIQTFEKTQLDGNTRQVFFFDPDGNGLEVGSWEN